jgi:spore coat assembly protein
MNDLKVGDIVVRKSYGNDVYFKIADIITKDGQKPVYVLKGLFYRIEADSNGEDLVRQDSRKASVDIEKNIRGAKNTMYRNDAESTTASRAGMSLFQRLSLMPGRILHIDADEQFLNICLKHYKEHKIPAVGKLAKESEQPGIVRGLLAKYRPNIVVLTGHDSYKKNADKHDINSYKNSKYFIESAKNARNFEPNPNRLCIFSGACQTFFELVMENGANFASSPGRVLINALDPAFVSQKIALTDSRTVVTPEKISELTISGSKGIGGVKTKGQLRSRYPLFR